MDIDALYISNHPNLDCLVGAVLVLGKVLKSSLIAQFYAEINEAPGQPHFPTLNPSCGNIAIDPYCCSLSAQQKPLHVGHADQILLTFQDKYLTPIFALPDVLALSILPVMSSYGLFCGNGPRNRQACLLAKQACNQEAMPSRLSLW
jgi:hypothetical protein